jgi:hypothetical protein
LISPLTFSVLKNSKESVETCQEKPERVCARAEIDSSLCNEVVIANLNAIAAKKIVVRLILTAGRRQALSKRFRVHGAGWRRGLEANEEDSRCDEQDLRFTAAASGPLRAFPLPLLPDDFMEAFADRFRKRK